MRRLLLIIPLFFAAFTVQGENTVRENLDAVQKQLQAGPDSEFHQSEISDTFAAALKNPFIGDSGENNSWIRILVFFSVLTLAIFLRLWKNAIVRKERESQQ